MAAFMRILKHLIGGVYETWVYFVFIVLIVKLIQ